MTSTNKDPILVVVQLTGGNDYINTVIPYQDPLYYDSRKTVSIAQDKVLPINDELAYDFDSWSDLSLSEGQPHIRTVRLSIPVPEVILLLSHDKIPSRNVPFSRRNLYRRDGFRCQYCGTRCPTQELSIDHVIPRSRGGRTSWENCVIACIPCNVKKGHRTLRAATMGLVRKPLRPHWSPCLQVSMKSRRASWERFVSDQYWSVTLDQD